MSDVYQIQRRRAERKRAAPRSGPLFANAERPRGTRAVDLDRTPGGNETHRLPPPLPGRDPGPGTPDPGPRPRRPGSAPPPASASCAASHPLVSSPSRRTTYPPRKDLRSGLVTAYGREEVGTASQQRDASDGPTSPTSALMPQPRPPHRSRPKVAQQPHELRPRARAPRPPLPSSATASPGTPGGKILARTPPPAGRLRE